MCTALTINESGLYFGRTLDLDLNYNSQIVITPRNFAFSFTNGEVQNSHYAIIGMATVSNTYPLYFDASNEEGLCIAGLNFSADAVFTSPDKVKDGIAPFEIIPYLLCNCKSVCEAKEKMKNKEIAEIPFSKNLGCAPLHWIVSDKQSSIVIEATKNGLNICDNPLGVLTNSPPFEFQLYNLNNYINLTTKTPENRFSEHSKLTAYSNGMGAMGLPGDYSSLSRFVRATFAKFNTQAENTEQDNLRRFFEILATVEIPKGLVKTNDGNNHYTLYSSCISAEKGIYYYKTNKSKSINAVSLFNENLNSDFLHCFPLNQEMKIKYLN